MTVIQIAIWALGTATKWLVQGLEVFEISIIKISQNTENIPGDLMRLAVTQTPVENYQLTLMWKTLK